MSWMELVVELMARSSLSTRMYNVSIVQGAGWTIGAIDIRDVQAVDRIDFSERVVYEYLDY